MNSIEIDDQVLAELSRRASGFHVSPNDVLRRILNLPQQAFRIATVTPTAKAQPSSATAATSTLLEFIKTEYFQRHHQAIDRFLIILGWLDAAHPKQFAEAAIEFQRGKRLYFAKTEKEILESGEGITARQIPKSSFWVLTTLDNKSKRIVVEEMLQSLGYSRSDINIVLSELPDSNIRRRHSKYDGFTQELNKLLAQEKNKPSSAPA